MSTLSLEERLAQMGRELKQELSAGKELSGGFFNQVGKLFVEQLLGAEVSDALGRRKGQRREDGEGVGEAATAGYRNGYKSRSLLTGEGEMEVRVPQVRDYAVGGEDQTYRSAIWAGLGKRSASLEKLIAEMYARGLSTRDIEDLLTEISEDGQTPLLSKSSVSQVTEVLWEQFDAFTDSPVARVYRELDQAYPGSKFVLTTRPLDKWMGSMRRMRPSFTLLTLLPKVRQLVTDLCGKPSFGDECALANGFLNYNRSVREYFGPRIGKDLLVLDVSTGDAWDRLCNFLGQDAPHREFPHYNRGYGTTFVNMRDLVRYAWPLT